jgi:hypothetical protein
METGDRTEKLHLKHTINISIEIETLYNRENTSETYNKQIDRNMKNKHIIKNIQLKHARNIWIEI